MKDHEEISVEAAHEAAAIAIEQADVIISAALEATAMSVSAYPDVDINEHVRVATIARFLMTVQDSFVNDDSEMILIIAARALDRYVQDRLEAAK